MKHKITDNQSLSIWDFSAEISFGEHLLFLQYETEPKMGDFIYSLCVGDKKFPYWLYARELVFFKTDFLFTDLLIYPQSWSGIKSAILNLKTKQFAFLKSWYAKAEYKDNFLLLKEINAETISSALSDKDLETLDWKNF